MASGEIEVTPGRVLSATERVDNQKLNDLGTPTLRVKALTITARELADGAINADKLSVDVEAQLGVQDNSVTTNKIVDGAVTQNKLAENARIPTATVVDFAGATAPDGWLLCGGQAVSRTTYAALFSALGSGTIWGAGDGSTTFNVPDLRGFVVAGKDDMVQGASARLTSAWLTGGGGPTVIGGYGGTQALGLTEAQMPSHAHGFSDTYAQLTGGAGGMQAGNNLNLYHPAQAKATDYRGSGAAHTNIQPTRIMNKIIRY